MSLVDVLSTAFAGLSVVALLFFLHKVVWLLRYKRLQAHLLQTERKRQDSAGAAALPEWQRFTSQTWRQVLGGHGINGLESPAGYLGAVQSDLSRLLGGLNRRAIISTLLRHTLAREQPSGAAHAVMELPLRDGKMLTANIALEPPQVIAPPPPSPGLYALNVRSRYSFFRRALVFVTGLADVVYSAHHLAKMSQHTHVPASLILRRLSLVVLLVFGIVLEVVLGLRQSLADYFASELPVDGDWMATLPSWLAERLPQTLALTLWTVVVAGLYFTLYFTVRKRSKLHLSRLRELEERQAERLSTIRERHLAELTRWADEYGAHLDAAVDLTARHIETLGTHFERRMAAQLVGPVLLQLAETVSQKLFEQLPEASGDLQDKATSRKHSWRHALWPRPEEMAGVVRQTQYRLAWQYLEVAVGTVRRHTPDPEALSDYWSQLLVYALSFDELFSDATIEQIRQGYETTVQTTVSAIEEESARFERIIGELFAHLNEQLRSATPLLAAQIDLTNQRILADADEMEAEVIRTREAARLEAMAFEI